MTVPVCVPTPGLASPSALQAPAAAKPKNGSVAISKPQEGQPHFSVPPLRTLRCCQDTCSVTDAAVWADGRAQLPLQSDPDTV